jgi:hypothetical protein
MRFHVALSIVLCAFAVPPAHAAGQEADPPEVVLFAFDDQAIPWHHNLQLTLVPAEKHPANPVLRQGPVGAPDYGHAILYGTVLKEGDKFRMWYLAMGRRKLERGQAPGYWRPMCYAESTDGVHWTKPELGLVEYNGGTRNNICLIEGEPRSLTLVDDFLSVLHEPDDPDPSRRYKAAYIAHVPIDEIPGGMSKLGVPEKRIGALVCATSPDGLRWKVVGDRPANAGGERFEVSGLYRFGNFYYGSGQLISPWCWLNDGRDVGRAMLTYRSPDLVSWSRAKALSFVRPGQLTNPPQAGQQTHMGAGLWNRGDVLVGLYGMWQDGPKERPKGSTHLFGTRIDLGLVVSNDGIHFREPVPNFKVIARGKEEEGAWDSIALLQGHAFANVGDRTYLWYSHWDLEGAFRSQEIGLATLRRDGFGYLSRRVPGVNGLCVTKTLSPSPRGHRFALNLAGVTAELPLTVELFDDFDRPVPGYSGPDAARVTTSGTRRAIAWPAQGDGRGPRDRPVSLRVTFPDSADVRLYAIYGEP